jgi:hypothetical protein
VFCVHCRYGNLVLAVEVISSTATIGYAILLIKQSKPKPSLGLPVADPNIPLHPDDVMFNLRVLVPCYKEKVCAAKAPAWTRKINEHVGSLASGRAQLCYW